MTQVCDNCLTAVHDEHTGFKLSTEEQAYMARDLGADIADHRCEQFDGGSPCDCACYGGPTEKRDQTETTPAYQSPQGFTGKRMGQPDGGATHSGFSRGPGPSGKGI